MSNKNYKADRLSKEEARKRILKVASEGRILISGHALKRMLQRNIIQNDIINVLRSASMRVSEAEPHLSGFTYRCQTVKFAVVVGFTVRGDGVIVVTVFKIERQGEL